MITQTTEAKEDREGEGCGAGGARKVREIEIRRFSGCGKGPGSNFLLSEYHKSLSFSLPLPLSVSLSPHPPPHSHPNSFLSETALLTTTQRFFFFFFHSEVAATLGSPGSLVQHSPFLPSPPPYLHAETLVRSKKNEMGLSQDRRKGDGSPHGDVSLQVGWDPGPPLGPWSGVRGSPWFP